MNFQQKKKLCILLISFLFLLAAFPLFFWGKKQPKGEYITTKEVQALTSLLLQISQAPALEEAEKNAEDWLQGELTYGQFQEWAEPLEAALELESGFDSKYQTGFSFLREDWYTGFTILCKRLDPEGRIKQEELLILGDSNGVKDIEGNPIGPNHLFSHNGLWENHLPFSAELFQKKGVYITCDDAIWGMVELLEEGELKNVWLVEANEDSLIYFYGNHEVTAFLADTSFLEREQVADLSFKAGILEGISSKKERISGEVLTLSEDKIEIKGQGIFELAEEIQYYRLYDSLETVGQNAVRIGYNFTDFVVEEGKIQAGLLVKDEQMDTIRVLLKTSNFDGYYHQEVELICDVDMHLIAGEKTLTIPARESLLINLDSTYFDEGRIYLQPAALTGRTRIPTIARTGQKQGYHGSFELEKREEGILVINKVLLEEYLYAVVPSEMPGYYPMEALKAQAVCARTYAYDKMLGSSLSAWGAHLDDSSTFQVYNNIQENTNTTKAVKETRGMLLYARDELAETYYYSTSSGFGTDDAIWNRAGVSQLPYLRAREMTQGEVRFTKEELMEEEAFREYIDNRYDSHFEAKEGWYRWTYSHQDMEHILENLRTRQQAYPNNILISGDGSSFTTGAVPKTLTLKNIEVKKRGAGGTVEELLFSCEELQILVRKELHIRAVLTDGVSSAILQDKKTYACRNLLPSAFFYLTVQREGEQVTGLTLKGGGFGHGVGMSQNGAKNLANAGRSYKEILLFYYDGCEVLQP